MDALGINVFVGLEEAGQKVAKGGTLGFPKLRGSPAKGAPRWADS